MAQKKAETTAVAEVQRGEVVAGDLPDLGTIAKEVLTGNLQHLTDEQQAQYLHAVCKSLGLNPLTHPFAIITFKGKKTLYARRECAEQLRRLYQVSVQITDQRQVGDLYIVSARATLPGGRTDENVGAVTIKGYAGDDLAHQIMKAVTKATRRATLGICGLGCLDESEIEQTENGRKSPLVAAISVKELDESIAMATGVQIDLIDTNCQEVGWSTADLQAALNKRYGCSDPRQLTQEQAEAVIAGLKKAAEKPTGKVTGKVTKVQADRIAELASELGWSEDRLASSLVAKFGDRDVFALTSEQASQVIAGMEQAKAKKAGGGK